MSVATIINQYGELEYKKIATNNVRLTSLTQEQNITAEIIKNLLDRISALEDYVLAHQATYTIANADGNPIKLVVDNTPDYRTSFLDLKGVAAPAESIPLTPGSE